MLLKLNNTSHLNHQCPSKFVGDSSINLNDRIDPSLQQKLNTLDLDTSNKEASNEVKTSNKIKIVNRLKANNELEVVYELEMVNDLEIINELEISNEIEMVNELEAKNELEMINETETRDKFESNNIIERSIKSDQLFTDENIHPKEKQNDTEEIKIEHFERLAVKFIKKNDTENIYNILSVLIQKGRWKIPLEYAISLYKKKCYQQSFNYFSILSKINHPIAKYFIGVMKFKGEGCEVSRHESYKILKHLSNAGIDKATEFLEDHFNETLKHE